jgi:preprotein translocase subunit SecE
VAKVANKVGVDDNRIARYFRETRSELRKVVWPTREEATNLTVIVMAVTIGMSALLGLIDLVFSRLFALLVH